jgi:hypothetical protein
MVSPNPLAADFYQSSAMAKKSGTFPNRISQGSSMEEPKAPPYPISSARLDEVAENRPPTQTPFYPSVWPQQPGRQSLHYVPVSRLATSASTEPPPLEAFFFGQRDLSVRQIGQYFTKFLQNFPGPPVLQDAVNDGFEILVAKYVP